MNFREITSIDSLTDPSRATDREHVERRARRVELPEAEFESVAEEHEGLGGHVLVGVVDAEDRVVLARPTDGERGWVPITGPVESGEDWITAAADWVEAFADATVEVGPIEHVRKLRYQPAGDPTRVVESYEVVVHARPPEDESLDLEDATVDGREWELETFEKLPAEVNDGDVPDVLPFFE